MAYEIGRPAYSDTRFALVEKFGDPPEIKKQTVQNRMGATFVGERLRWVSGEMELVLEEYGTEIDKFLVTVEDAKGLAEYSRKAHQQPDI